MNYAPILADPPDGIPSSDAVSAAVDDGTYVFVSGTVGYAIEGQQGCDDPEFQVPMAIGIQDQTSSTLTQISCILAARDLGLPDDVKANAFLAGYARGRQV